VKVAQTTDFKVYNNIDEARKSGDHFCSSVIDPSPEGTNTPPPVRLRTSLTRLDMLNTEMQRMQTP
jgi:hypothetical protein